MNFLSKFLSFVFVLGLFQQAYSQDSDNKMNIYINSKAIKAVRLSLWHQGIAKNNQASLDEKELPKNLTIINDARFQKLLK